jgi:hypothetical protein
MIGSVNISIAGNCYSYRVVETQADDNLDELAIAICELPAQSDLLSVHRRLSPCCSPPQQAVKELPCACASSKSQAEME